MQGEMHNDIKQDIGMVLFKHFKYILLVSKLHIYLSYLMCQTIKYWLIWFTVFDL